MKKLSKVLSVLLAVVMLFGAISITAAAADTYQVKYHANGGSGTMTNSTHEFGVEKALTANKITRKGYAFLGWAKTKTATEPEFYDKQVVVDIAEEGQTVVTLYAVWKAYTYYVAYDANGGEGAMDVQTFTYGETQNLTANTFTRDGYTFRGWGKSSTTSTVSYTDGKSVKNLTQNDGATITLYALWEKNPVFVSEIFIEAQPTKTEYVVGDAFDATGLVVKANMTDHTVKEVTGYTISTPDMTTAGEKVVTVTYEGFTATFTITVAEKPAEPEYNYTFSIVAPANKEVAHGESVVVSAKIEGTYPAGMYVECTANNANFIPTLNADGSYTLTANGVGATVFTAILYTADGQVAAQDSVELVALAEEVEEPTTEPEEPTTEPEEPSTEPEEPSSGIDIMSIILMLIDLVMGYLQPIIDLVMGLIAG